MPKRNFSYIVGLILIVVGCVTIDMVIEAFFGVNVGIGIAAFFGVKLAQTIENKYPQ